MDENTINTAYDELQNAMVTYDVVVNSVANAKNDYEVKRAKGLASGLISGKNEDERKANTASTLKTELETLRKAEDEMRRAKLELDIAYLVVERIKTILKYQALALSRVSYTLKEE